MYEDGNTWLHGKRMFNNEDHDAVNKLWSGDKTVRDQLIYEKIRHMPEVWGVPWWVRSAWGGLSEC